MRIGLIADIHGNLLALETVLAHLKSHPVDRLVCLGDVAISGPQPHQTLQRLQAALPLCIQGSRDAWVLDPQPRPPGDPGAAYTDEIDRWCAGQLTPEDRESLANFALEVELPLPDGRLLYGCHGSPRSMYAGLSPGLPWEVLEERLDGKSAAVLASGYTHAQGSFYHRGQLLINPGSVGLPLRSDPGRGLHWYAPFAEYAVLEAGRDDLGVHFYRLAYDIERLVALAYEVGMPETGWWVSPWERGLALGR
jgi:predicted phosphodiesterase